MADVHTIEQLHFNMQQMRSKNTRPEMLVRRFLHAHGFRYRLHDKKLPGKPDAVLAKYRTVIFVGPATETPATTHGGNLSTHSGKGGKTNMGKKDYS